VATSGCRPSIVTPVLALPTNVAHRPSDSGEANRHAIWRLPASQLAGAIGVYRTVNDIAARGSGDR
jgi:hypothetical protein